MVAGDFNQTVTGGSTELVSWKDVRASIAKLNPALAKIVDDIDPDKKCRLYRCRYSYGSEVLQRGLFFLPNEHGHLVPITDDSLSKQIREDLSYNHHSNPVSVLLKGTMEMFYAAETKVSTFGLISPGHMFGAALLLEENPITSHPSFLWGLTAGARSVLMLPKISESVSHNQLKRKFQLSTDKPEGFIDHWEVFRQLANHAELTKEPWQCEVIFFSKNWFEHLTTDPVWQPLHYYLLRQSWLKTRYLRDLLFWNCIYGLLQSRTSIKPSAYIIEVVKHIFAMGVGALPGFAPAIDETSLPVKTIQQAYLEVYRLKQYLPVIMQPQLLDLSQESTRPIYYSLQCPSSLGLTPKTVSGASAMVELSEIEFLFEKYRELMLHQPLNISHTDIYQFAQLGCVDYFHSSVPEHPAVKNVSELLEQDASFQKILVDHASNQVFPETSSFLRGCVRISRK